MDAWRGAAGIRPYSPSGGSVCERGTVVDTPRDEEDVPGAAGGGGRVLSVEDRRRLELGVRKPPSSSSPGETREPELRPGNIQTRNFKILIEEYFITV